MTALSAKDVAAYLEAHSEFFNDFPELLTALSLVSPRGQRTVSLQERQMEMLRDKLRVHEQRLADLLRFGQENDVIAEKLNRLVKQLFLERNTLVLPDVLVRELKQMFSVPAVAIRLWGLAIGGDQPYAAPVSDDTKSFAQSLLTPYCGPNAGFEAVQWLSDSGAIQSVALVPLRAERSTDAFGLLVLGSPEAERFASTMGTTYLARIEEVASAALLKLVR